MKVATISEIKQELGTEKTSDLINICLRLAKFKKDNKELLSYLLFESKNEEQYIDDIKQEISDEFDHIKRLSPYQAKKVLRKLNRLMNKYCRYTDQEETEIQLRIHFCSCMLNNPLKPNKDKTARLIYNSHLKKTEALISALHPDLQYDYLKLLNALVSPA